MAGDTCFSGEDTVRNELSLRRPSNAAAALLITHVALTGTTPRLPSGSCTGDRPAKQLRLSRACRPTLRRGRAPLLLDVLAPDFLGSVYQG